MIACLGVPSPARAERRLLEDLETPFQRIRVVEDAALGERYLFTEDDRFMQGMISLRQPGDLHPEYLRSALLGLVFIRSNPKAMLFVGLGAGSLPRYLDGRYPRAVLDVVEIDPAVPPIARKYFSFPRTGHLKVFVREGRDFVRGRSRRYDLILVDAYFGSEVPGHLATQEFMIELRRALRPGGVVVANLPAPPLLRSFWAVLATYRSAFPEVRVYQTPDAANLILIASEAARAPGPDEIRARLDELRDRRHIAVDLKDRLERVPYWASAPVPARVLHDPEP